MDKVFFAYVRVSTAKQGEKGVSLQEQHDAIVRYSQSTGLRIAEWFEERESAAKRGRPVFARMLKLLRQGKAHGLVIHKIDRGARNLKDWADLGDMIDAGIEVHFATESLDLQTRGGRLSADIQAVVAADFIRNLREETRKGFYGRLKQGLYPIAAPVGYLDRGKGQVKEIDPRKGPMVRRAFELYGTGRYGLHALLMELHLLGLRNRRGHDISLNGLSIILNNPFYIGMIRIRKTNELFPGRHEPLVTSALFNRVQLILKGKTVDRMTLHDFLFRRMVRCVGCGYSLIGERQKGHVYYRCHTADCPTTAVREEGIEAALAPLLGGLELNAEELEYLKNWVTETRLDQGNLKAQELKTWQLKLDSMQTRLHRLTDMLIDGTIEKPLFEDRKNALLLEQREAKDRILDIEKHGGGLARLEKFLELVKSASLLYKTADTAEKRELVRELTSNLKLGGKNVIVEPKVSVQLLLERSKDESCSPQRGVPRTFNGILEQLLKYFVSEAASAN